MDHDGGKSAPKGDIVRRAGWKAVSHLVRHHPGAALGAAGAGAKFAAGELMRRGANRVRRIGEKLRPARAKQQEPSLADCLDESELKALARLGTDRKDDKKA